MEPSSQANHAHVSRAIAAAKRLVPAIDLSIDVVRAEATEIISALGLAAELSELDGLEDADNVAEAIEAEAVALWNESVTIRVRARAMQREGLSGDHETALEVPTVARLRGASLVMMVVAKEAAGAEASQSWEVSTGRSFQEIKDLENAEAAFAEATKHAYNESLDKNSVGISDAILKSSALLLTYQAELVWESAPSNVAFHLVNRACSPLFLGKLTIREIEIIIGTCMKLSKTSESQNDRIQWLKVALKLVEGTTQSDKLTKRKNEVLLTMASEYLLSNQLDNADSIVDTLLENSEGLIVLGAVQIKLDIMHKKEVTACGEYEKICNILQKRVPMTNASDEAVAIFMSILHLIAPISTDAALSLGDWLVAQNSNIPSKASLFEKVFLTKIHLLTSSESRILKEDAILRVKEAIRTAERRTGQGVSTNTAKMAQMVVWKCGIKMLSTGSK
ncbi:hypothetical protein HDU82_007789 [Entophlyctis luteolus]|nr:hypothetical protein HDU82_007789 [Entophlyctis luteolus]